MIGPQETELKFLFSSQDLPKIEATPRLQELLQQAERKRLEATYFDTPNRSLWENGITLRVRKSGKTRVQTLKQATTSDIDRGEWEEEIAQDTLDFDAIEHTPFARLICAPEVRNALAPSFEVDVERASFSLDAAEAQIEGALDQGQIEADGQAIPVCELELELKQGDRIALFEFARKLASQLPLTLSFISKAERGHLLANGLWAHSAKASQPKLDPDMTCGQAFQIICRTCLHDFMLNLMALESDDEVEAVHKGRVSLRRLRANLTLFKQMIEDDAFEHLSGELKWLADLFGAARDRDVFQMKIFAPAAEKNEIHGAKDLADYMEDRRREAHEEISQSLKSERFRILLVDLASWIEEGEWTRRFAKKAAVPIQDFAAAQLRKRRKKLVEQGEGLAGLGARARHLVRIQAKKLRYMAEFFADVRGVAAAPKTQKQLIQSLEELQTSLGEMHDAEAQVEFLKTAIPRLCETGHGLAGFAADALARSVDDMSDQLAIAISAYSKLVEAEAY